MIWWAARPGRAAAERLAIAELRERSDWLGDVTWSISSEGRLIAAFDMVVADQSIALTLTYPGFFPHMPPQVRPRDKVRLSGHQYGAGGELCLEYRPDNWEPSFTGAMMIESAQRLLAGELPTDGGLGDVPDVHRATLGQDARAATWRFILPAEARTALGRLELHKLAELVIADYFVAKHWLAFPRLVTSGSEVLWDAQGTTPKFRARKGYVVRLAPSLGKHIDATYAFVELLVEAFGDAEASARVAASTDELPLLIECGGAFTLISLSPGEGSRTVWRYQTVPMPAASVRLPADYDRLDAMTVAVLGCGSVGSKIAASLARAGVGGFVLVDGDLLLPGNLVRHDLDWRGVGLNKPDAVGDRVRKIRPDARIDLRRSDLGGQESSASTDAALAAIGKCQIVIDATADPQVYNLAGAVARAERKTLIWGEVFGGGIGGLVARLRPDLDPVPHAARRQILAWCADQGKEPPPTSATQYELDLDADAPPLIADDADVSLIAGHMTRLALDAMLRTESIFPHSAYAIGLKPGWIFDAPFETWPIMLSAEGAWGPEMEDGYEEQLQALVTEFFPAADAGEAG